MGFNTRLAVVGGLLVLAIMTPAQTYRTNRPIRGAWLRPPGSAASAIEPNLQQLANAGITDLYLETFYWGISTGKAGVFNARFTSDYLAATIPLASKYGIRVHAWCEAGYWQSGTTGAYNFTNNPEWKVINTSTGLEGGDQAGQVFANLCHPGVQQKLRNYTAELATYPGIWGVQTDYHRMPTDNNTGDVYTAPWSYDTYSQSAFQALYGADINTTARKPGDPQWNNFYAWRQNGISQAANQMYQGIQGVSDDVVFGGAVFPTPATEISKCQDWPSWVTGGYIDHVTPMCYGSSSSSIKSAINSSKPLAGSKRYVVGLATTGISGHPAVDVQMTAIKQVSVEDFIIFEGTYFSTVANQPLLKNWLSTNATKMRGDYDDNGVLDYNDLKNFWTVYRGANVSASGRTRYDWNADNTVSRTDHDALRLALRQYILGENGKYSSRDLAAFNNASALGAPPAGYRSFYDLNGDAAVNSKDRELFLQIAQTTPMVFITLDLEAATPDREVAFEWRNPGSSTVIQSWKVTPTATGKTAVPSPGAGTYDLSVKESHWLRRTIPVTIAANDITDRAFSLLNGDIDGDNTVSILDYSILSDYFDRSSTDSDWLTIGGNGFAPADADLDEDATVSILDYSVLSTNFDINGDS